MEIHHLHLYVEDALHWRHWFMQRLGFRPFGVGPRVPPGTWGVKSGQVTWLISQPHPAHGRVAQFLATHGQGVGDVAFRVQDWDRALGRARGAGVALLEPVAGPVGARVCQVQGWGSLGHTLVEHQGPGLSPAIAASPNLDALTMAAQGSGDRPPPWQAVDHSVLNVAAGDLAAAVQWYQQGFGFQPQQRFTITTPHSGLRSVVLRHPEGGATLPINEPLSATSQIQEFLDHYGGSGIQHVALQGHPLPQRVAYLRAQGIEFLPVPPTYYDLLRQRPQFWAEAGDWEVLAQQQILVDWQPQHPHCRLLQTFTQPLFSQPTLFLELIERQGTPPPQGFGEGNFQALFEAMERQQRQRGRL